MLTSRGSYKYKWSVQSESRMIGLVLKYYSPLGVFRKVRQDLPDLLYRRVDHDGGLRRERARV